MLGFGLALAIVATVDLCFKYAHSLNLAFAYKLILNSTANTRYGNKGAWEEQD